MANIVSTTISACGSTSSKKSGGKWWPGVEGRPRASQQHLYVPYYFKTTNGCGVVWLLKSTLVGAGGTTYTVTDASSTIVIAE